MDINHDEIRRQRRETQADHDAAMPLFGRALDRAFDPDGGVSETDKAQLVGVPDRRGFLKIGGLTFGMAALAAACVQQTKVTETMAQTGTLIPAPSTSVPPFTGSDVLNATLVLTALSLERLAAQAYSDALSAGYLSTASVADLAKSFRDQHVEHAVFLGRHATALGQNPDAVKPNEAVNSTVIAPALEAIKAESSDKAKAEADTLALALSIEDGAAQLYAHGGGTMTTPELRAALTSIGAVEARHYSVLAGLLGKPVAPFAFEHTTPSAVPVSAYIQADAAKVPKTGTTIAQSSTTTTKR